MAWTVSVFVPVCAKRVEIWLPIFQLLSGADVALRHFEIEQRVDDVGIDRGQHLHATLDLELTGTDARDGGDTARPLQPVFQLQRQDAGAEAPRRDDVVGLHRLVDRRVDRASDRRAEDRDEHDERNPDHQRGSSCRGSLRVTRRVALREAPGDAAHRPDRRPDR
jgi:hypothetical protein